MKYKRRQEPSAKDLDDLQYNILSGYYKKIVINKNSETIICDINSVSRFYSLFGNAVIDIKNVHNTKGENLTYNNILIPGFGYIYLG